MFSTCEEGTEMHSLEAGTKLLSRTAKSSYVNYQPRVPEWITVVFAHIKKKMHNESNQDRQRGTIEVMRH